MRTSSREFPEKNWFEMQDLKRRQYNNSVWIPLCKSQYLSRVERYGDNGHKQEFAACFAVMFDGYLEESALKLAWQNVTVNWDNRPWAEGREYFEAGRFRGWHGAEDGKYLVIQQSFDGLELPEWHLDQDLVMALGLLRENDAWLSPADDYVEVARLTRDESGAPIVIEIRSEYLKDYLKARNAGLLVANFDSRTATTADHSLVPWSQSDVGEQQDDFRWMGYVREIHEGGMPFGESAAVFHIRRDDVPYEDDVPVFQGPPDENFTVESWEKPSSGAKLYAVSAEIWKNEWISPADNSPRVKGDYVPSVIPFVTGADGATSSGDDLKQGLRWIWFKPGVVESLRNRRGGYISWSTRETGRLGVSQPYSIPFGVNSLGLINVMADDVANLPEAHKKIWVAHNCSPEGQVSQELLTIQAEGSWVLTTAPEFELWEKMESLQTAFERRFSQVLFRPSATFMNPGCHRFVSDDLNGMFLLSKELIRSTIEHIDQKALKDLTPGEPSNTRTLKRLEKLITQAGADGRSIMGPLFAVYELRQFDAHVSANDVSNEFALLGLDINSDKFVEHGKNMIEQVATTFATIASCFEPENGS